MAKGNYQRSSRKGVEIKNRVRGTPTSGGSEPLNHEQERIQKWLKQIRFKRSFFGGVDEADVWKKITELNNLYEVALSAERARYDALLAERTASQRRKQAESIRSAEHRKAGDEADG